MSKCIFITGTDTDVGKTFISSLILKALKRERLLTCGFKPIASGSYWTLAKQNAKPTLVNPDALTLQRNASITLAYPIVNPFCFEPAIAPHVAASDAAVEMSVRSLDKAFNELKQAVAQSSDVILCEGAGGWHVPLNNQEHLSDWVVGQGMGVILVVGLKLGCINHALLTVQAIIASGLPLLGWVANQPIKPPMEREAETLNYLKGAIEAPLLANITHVSDPAAASLNAKETQALLTAIGYSSPLPAT